MKSVTLTAYTRGLSRRSGSKKLRRQGRIPAVIYGRQIQAQNLELKAEDLEEMLHHAASENILVDLSVEGDDRPQRLALVQEIQHHALNDDVLHVDFHEVSPTEKVTVMVPTEAVGEAEGVKSNGGVLEHVLFKIRARGLPKDLPEVIHVDVGHLQVGQSVHLGEIKVPEGVEILGDKHVPVFSVAAPLTEAQEAAAEAAAAAGPAEPEVLREKKDEEGAPAEKAAEKGAEKAPDKAAEKGAEKKAEKPDKKK